MKRLLSSIVLWTVLVFVPAPAAAQITIPEPSTDPLMATGLAFLFVFGRKGMGRLADH